ncbi:hypothetical protein Y032_0015g2573 [Ancylostoma ceylanicum]|uniref:Saposin B-type domain-containing protein n=1 Tax=Ancylostoma ceylanicum TaxID=53326 RepID=A0A016V751_9BILA|nr:hypothetical protein Y032_0015g2573 [Ancylostoma ceylanicum]
MIPLLCLSLLMLIDAKSLTIVPSASFHGKDGKVDSTDFIKEPVAVEYEDIEATPAAIQPRTNFRVDFTKSNGTDIVASRRTIFEVIPVDYLCDFCMAVIEKLKYRQKVEPDFEKTPSTTGRVRGECASYSPIGGLSRKPRIPLPVFPPPSQGPYAALPTPAPLTW